MLTTSDPKAWARNESHQVFVKLKNLDIALQYIG